MPAALGTALFVMWFVAIDGVVANIAAGAWGYDELDVSRVMAPLKDVAAWVCFAAIALELARRFAGTAPLMQLARKTFAQSGGATR